MMFGCGWKKCNKQMVVNNGDLVMVESVKQSPTKTNPRDWNIYIMNALNLWAKLGKYSVSIKPYRGIV